MAATMVEANEAKGKERRRSREFDTIERPMEETRETSERIRECALGI
jgi:hypothetical protein